jgi:hypothetical protein
MHEYELFMLRSQIRDNCGSVDEEAVSTEEAETSR